MTREGELLDHITVRPGVFRGKPIFRDMSSSVEQVPANPAASGTTESLLNDYPLLELQDIRAPSAAHRLRLSHVTVTRALREIPW